MGSGEVRELLVVVATIVLAGGLFFSAFSGYQAVTRMEELDAAEPVEATVLESSVERNTSSIDGRRSVAYSPEITYRYTYRGERYTNDVVFPGSVRPSTSEREARSVVRKHPAGERVTVYVVPGEPRNTFLVKRPVTIQQLLLPAAGGVLCAVGLVVLHRNALATSVGGWR